MSTALAKTPDSLGPIGTKEKPLSMSMPVSPSRDSPRGSILKKSMRYDAATTAKTPSNFKESGSKSVKGKDKNGKLTFSDNLNQVKEVDNWKKYNSEEETHGKACCNTF